MNPARHFAHLGNDRDRLSDVIKKAVCGSRIEWQIAIRDDLGERPDSEFALVLDPKVSCEPLCNVDHARCKIDAENTRRTALCIFKTETPRAASYIKYAITLERLQTYHVFNQSPLNHAPPPVINELCDLPFFFFIDCIESLRIIVKMIAHLPFYLTYRLNIHLILFLPVFILEKLRL